MNSLGLLAALMAVQGQALQLGRPHEAGLTSIEVSWDERQIPYLRVGDQWLSVIGIDLDLTAGEYPLEATLRYEDGRVEMRSDVVHVSGKAFPTTELTVAPGYVELSPENQERAARDSSEINAIYSTLTPQAYWVQPFQVPIPGTTGGRNFGHRRVFNGEPRAPHSGADLTAATGAEIRAVNAGRVVLAKDLFFSGNAVFIDHGLGVYSVYLHLSKIDVAEGDIVDKGQTVGLVGATGRVTGPHLHWGFRIQNARIDPFSLTRLSD